MEEQSTIIELVDESGNNVKFDLVMTFDYEGKRYAALLPWTTWKELATMRLLCSKS